MRVQAVASASARFSQTFFSSANNSFDDLTTSDICRHFTRSAESSAFIKKLIAKISDLDDLVFDM